MVKISPNDFLTNCLQMGSTVKMEHFKETSFRRLFSPSLLMIKRSRLRKSLNNTVILVSSSMKKNEILWSSKIQRASSSTMRIQLENTVYTIRIYVWNFDLKKTTLLLYCCVFPVLDLCSGVWFFFWFFFFIISHVNCALDRYFLGFQRLTSPFLL